MNKTWKWILGITLGFVILAGVGFLAANYFGFGHMPFWGGPAIYGRPMMDGYGFDDRGPMGNYQNFRHPMMGGRGFGGYGFWSMPFFFIGGLLRLVFPLGILVLVAFFSYRAGKQAGLREAQVLPALEPEPEKTE
jgi:hypothetical protein